MANTRTRNGGTWRGKTGPKLRPVCGGCGKKGMGAWKFSTFAGVVMYASECRYCGHTEKEIPAPLPPLRERLCTPVTIEQAAALTT